MQKIILFIEPNDISNNMANDMKVIFGLQIFEISYFLLIHMFARTDNCQVKSNAESCSFDKAI